jgi:hypothetical protein
VPDELGVPEEPERRVERDAGDEDDRLRQRAADQQQPEQHLDRARHADELEVAHPDAELLGDVEVGVVGEEREREIGRRELLGERDDDQRRARRDAQREDRAGRARQRQLARRRAALGVRRPRPGPDEQDEDREPEQVDALQDRPTGRTRASRRARRR